VDLPTPFQPLPSEEALEDELDWPEDESTEAIEASLLQTAATTETPAEPSNSLDAVLESIFEDLGNDDEETDEANPIAQLLPQPFVATPATMEADYTEEAPHTEALPAEPAAVEEVIREEPLYEESALPSFEITAELPKPSFSSEEQLIANASDFMDKAASLEKLLERADLKSMDEMLAVTAYFLTTHQNEPHFSLKRLNDTITELGYASFTHGDMELAVNQQWLAVLPDKNSFTEATLYELTEQGHYFSQQQLGT
jgi:hypothetical protein